MSDAFPPIEAAEPADATSAGAFTPSDSPCVAICSTLFDEVCRGCGRTAAEVSNWVFLSEDEKRQVWQRIRMQGYPRRG